MGYLRYISGISQVYLRYISGISQVYLRVVTCWLDGTPSRHGTAAL
jgi:hypothetical protein